MVLVIKNVLFFQFSVWITYMWMSSAEKWAQLIQYWLGCLSAVCYISHLDFVGINYVSIPKTMATFSFVFIHLDLGGELLYSCDWPLCYGLISHPFPIHKWVQTSVPCSENRCSPSSYAVFPQTCLSLVNISTYGLVLVVILEPVNFQVRGQVTTALHRSDMSKNWLP